MNKTVDDLAAQAGRVLGELGYLLIRRYTATWNKVRRWCARRGVERFDVEQERLVVVDWGLDGEELDTAATGIFGASGLCYR